MDVTTDVVLNLLLSLYTQVSCKSTGTDPDFSFPTNTFQTLFAPIRMRLTVYNEMCSSNLMRRESDFSTGNRCSHFRRR
jgi:hypothetical protein